MKKIHNNEEKQYKGSYRIYVITYHLLLTIRGLQNLDEVICYGSTFKFMNLPDMHCIQMICRIN